MKIIASDYDGTLNYGGITKEKNEAILRWQEDGNLFVLVTGRGAEDAIKMREADFFPCDYILANNGSVIMNEQGEVIGDCRCEGELAEKFIRFLFKNGCSWACVHIDKEVFYVYKDKADAEEKSGCTLKTMMSVPFFTQINVALTDFNEAMKVTQLINNEFGNFLNPLQNGRCIDIVSAESDKAKGIYKLLAVLGAEYDDVITIGDNINDEHMIKEFRSYAMANGVDYIKQLADDVTKGITELIYKEMKKTVHKA